MSYCGIKAHVKYRVSPELVGELGTVTIDRLGRNTTITATKSWKIDKTKMKFEWPDLQKENSTEFYGGRKVDWRGLNKVDYKTKFDAQEFEITLKVGAKGKGSTKQVIIKQHPDVAPEHQDVGFTMDILQGQSNPLGVSPTGGIQVVPIPSSIAQQAQWVQSNIGDFWTEYKEGLVIITVKVELWTNNPGKTVDDRVFNHFKKRVELFWNGPDGFRQWVFHNKKCLRKDRCNCKVLFSGETSPKEKLVVGGCCKFPVRVNIEKGGDNRVHINFMSPQEVQNIYLKNIQTGSKDQAPYPFNTVDVCYPEDVPHSYAHEVGHMMGLPDEYPAQSQGTIDANQGTFPIDNDSIMGVDMNRAKKRHFEWRDLSRKWVSAKVTAVKAINRNP